MNVKDWPMVAKLQREMEKWLEIFSNPPVHNPTVDINPS